MKRREFITLLGGGAVAWPLAARAQQRPTPRIGVIDQSPIWDHFRQGLNELGYVDGRDIIIEYRSAQGQPDQLAAAASELAGLSVDVIVTSGSAATHAAQQATRTIPIVMIAIGDPVRAGFVRSLARPGGNITGNTILGTEMAAKRVQLLKELVPGVSRVAFLWNPNNGSHLAYLEEWRAVAPKLGVEPLLVELSRSDQLETAFAAMMRERPDALSVTADPFHLSQIGWIVDFVAKNRLPAIYVVKENVVAGGLMSYGPSLADLYRRAAGYVHKILQGTQPADLPVEQPVIFELAVNLKTAKAAHRRRGGCMAARSRCAAACDAGDTLRRALRAMVKSHCPRLPSTSMASTSMRADEVIEWAARVHRAARRRAVAWPCVGPLM